MAVRETKCDAAPEVVWSLLADGWSYSLWVPGTQVIRGVEAGWPRPGTKLEYQAGAGLWNFQQVTTVLDWEEGRRLDLEAHAWPLGTAYVGLEVRDDGTGGSIIRCEERPKRGPGRLMNNPVVDMGVAVRLDLLLRRLRDLARWQALRAGEQAAPGHSTVDPDNVPDQAKP